MFEVFHGLGVPFDHLPVDVTEAQQATGCFMHTATGAAPTFPTEVLDDRVHSAALFGRRTLPLVVAPKTRQLPPRLDWSTRGGEEILLVLEGRTDHFSEHSASIEPAPGERIYSNGAFRARRHAEHARDLDRRQQCCPGAGSRVPVQQPNWGRTRP